MGQLSERDYKQIAKTLGVSDRGIKRLLTDTCVVLQPQPAARPAGAKSIEPRSTKMRLGLSLHRGEAVARVESLRLAKVAAEALREYMATCPDVTTWVIRGDFDPSRPPSGLTKARITFACRAAGRIRAQAIQKLGM